MLPSTECSAFSSKTFVHTLRRELFCKIVVVRENFVIVPSLVLPSFFWLYYYWQLSLLWVFVAGSLNIASFASIAFLYKKNKFAGKCCSVLAMKVKKACAYSPRLRCTVNMIQKESLCCVFFFADIRKKETRRRVSYLFWSLVCIYYVI